MATDQEIRDRGFKYVPQQKYLLNPFELPENQEPVVNQGIVNTNSFTNMNAGGGEGLGIQTLGPYSVSRPSPINSAAFTNPLNQKLADKMKIDNPNLQSRTNEEIIESYPDMFDIKTDRGFFQNTADRFSNFGSSIADKFSGLPGVEKGKGLIRNILDNTLVGRFAAMRNPLNPNASNYNPNLQGQIDFLSGLSSDGNMMIGRDPNSGLAKYGPDSILSGQNVVSGFGTNDYGKQLQNYYDKYADTMSPERLEKLEAEMAALGEKEEEDYQNRIKDFVTNYNRPGVKGMFDKVYDGTNIHGGDNTTGGTTTPDGSGDGQGIDISGAGTVRSSDNNFQGDSGPTNQQESEYGYSTDFGFARGGRVNFKHGGLASIL